MGNAFVYQNFLCLSQNFEIAGISNSKSGSSYCRSLQSNNNHIAQLYPTFFKSKKIVQPKQKLEKFLTNFGTKLQVFVEDFSLAGTSTRSEVPASSSCTVAAEATPTTS